MQHLISIADLTNDEIEEIFALADRAQELRKERPATGHIMATLFYEPSTRTRLSFESAMQRLGGSVISCSDMKSSSTAKGETIADTAKVVSSYADVLVVRHHWDGAVQAMAEHADVPVINAGDGAHEHPTQTLCDLYTLRKEKGALKGLTVVVCGDLRNGRTIHSLVFALARFSANVVTLAANGMALPQYVIERLEREYGYGLAPVAANDLSTVVTETDALYLTPKQPHQLALFTQVDEVIQARLSSMATGLRYDAFYMTRKQKERMKDGASGSYPSIGADFLREQRFQDTVVMHPLPRVDELSPEVDKDRRGIYFKQAAYGVPVRMALLQFLFDRREKLISARKHRSVVYESPEAIGPQCRNPNCVTLNEPVSTRRRFQILSPEEGGTWVIACLYCDHRNKVQYIGNAKSKRYSSFDPGLVTSLREWLKTGELAIFDTIKEAEELGYEPIKSGQQRILLNESEIEQALVDIARQILRDCQNPDRLLILGIRSVGAQLAQRLAQEIEKQRQRRPESGEIEIFSAGEELRRASPADPDAGPLNLKDREVILVDDVLYTGRTVKSALSIIFRSGRPQSVRLAVLIDRGHREVPVRPNYVGKNIPTAENERVRVKLRGLDQENRDQAVLYSIDHAAGAAALQPGGEGAVALR
ncbi:MAG TPA: aspartate carbamoyltransferase catalytic subunit [Candidatus Binatia bacterium]|nr:aspartate carbamoyltransferase catalytic subunit [Candidatus Binatia bacterium]